MTVRPRRVFAIVAGVLLLALFVVLVVRPAIERGGVGEILFVVAAFVAVLLFERYLRTRA